MIYETKGLTLEQVDELYDEVKVARHSVGWRPTTTFREIRASVAAQGGMGNLEAAKAEKREMIEGQNGSGHKRELVEDENGTGSHENGV